MTVFKGMFAWFEYVLAVRCGVCFFLMSPSLRKIASIATTISLKGCTSCCILDKNVVAIEPINLINNTLKKKTAFATFTKDKFED